MQCAKCGSHMSDNARFCPKCGAPVQDAAPIGQPPSPFGEPQYQGQFSQYPEQQWQQPEPQLQPQPPLQPQQWDQAYQTQYGQQVPVGGEGYTPNNGKSKATASLVMGIIGLVLDFLVFWIVAPAIGCILGVVGVIMASGAKKEGYVGGIATGGLVCSIISIVFGIGSLLCVVCAFGAAGGIGLMAQNGRL